MNKRRGLGFRESQGCATGTRICGTGPQRRDPHSSVNRVPTPTLHELIGRRIAKLREDAELTPQHPVRFAKALEVAVVDLFESPRRPGKRNPRRPSKKPAG